MTIAELKELVLFMKSERVESFEVNQIKVTFNTSAFVSDIISEIESTSPKDIDEDEENLFYST